MKQPDFIAFRVTSNKKGTGIELTPCDDDDVVEVVRCQNCVWYGEDIFDRGGFCKRVKGLDMNDDDYCSRGKRKKEK